MRLFDESLRTISHVDDSENLVNRVSKQRRAIRAEPNVYNFVFMVPVSRLVRSASSVPKVHNTVCVSRGESAAICCSVKASDLFLMLLESLALSKVFIG